MRAPSILPLIITDHARYRARSRGIPTRALKVVCRHGEVIRTTPDHTEARKSRRGMCDVRRLSVASPLLRRALDGQGEGQRALTVVVNAWGEVVTAYFTGWREEDEYPGREAS